MPDDIQRDRVGQLQAEGAQIVEVLGRDEYDQEHIAGALSLPLSDLTREHAEHLAETNAQRVLVTDADGHLIRLLRRDDVEHALHTAVANGPLLALGTDNCG
jgi:rhodanese-related sulfurtransferase